MSKTVTNEILFEMIVDKDNMYKAYRKALEGNSKYSPDAMIFFMDEVYNLNKLIESLKSGSFEFSGYKKFKVYEPKERIIHAPYFVDKIVQLAINNIIKEIYNPTFIFDSYASIEGKGTHKCAIKIHNSIKRAKWEYGPNTYIVKSDIKKFYYSIDRDILKAIIAKKIKCNRTLELIFKIIDSADAIDEKGLPLGNTLSQICANIYMNELDQHFKRRLGVKYYVRYMDDFFMIVHNKTEAKKMLSEARRFVVEELNMELHEEKSKVFPVNQGVNAIGFKIFDTHMLLRDDSKKKMKRKLRAFPRSIIEKGMPIKKAEQMLNSWKGHAELANSYNFIQSLLDKHDYLMLENNGNKTLFKINYKKLREAYNDSINKRQLRDIEEFVLEEGLIIK